MEIFLVSLMNGGKNLFNILSFSDSAACMLVHRKWLRKISSLRSPVTLRSSNREIDSHGWHLANSFVRAEHIILQFAYRFLSTSITKNETYWHFLNLLFFLFFVFFLVKECWKTESLILLSPGGKQKRKNCKWTSMSLGFWQENNINIHFLWSFRERKKDSKQHFIFHYTYNFSFWWARWNEKENEKQTCEHLHLFSSFKVHFLCVWVQQLNKKFTVSNSQ